MLDRFKEIYDALNACEVKGGAVVRAYKFSVEHFELNSYNKMRVFLAMYANPVSNNDQNDKGLL